MTITPSESSAIQHGDQPQTPAPFEPLALPQATADEFLPPPGAWSRQLGMRVAGAAGVILLLACLWPFDETVRAAGSVRPRGENSPVQALGGGRLRRVLVKPNQQVSKGDLLAELETDGLESGQRQLMMEKKQLEEQLRQSEAQLKDLEQQSQSIAELLTSQIAAARGGVDQALAGARFQDRELQRLRGLAAQGAIPQLLVEEKEAGFAVARSQLQQARLGVGEQRARLQAEQARLRQALSAALSGQADLQRQRAALEGRLRENALAKAHSRLLAPLNGTVVETKLRYPGQVLQPGEVVATLAPIDQPLAVRIQLPSRDVASLKRGQTAHLRFSSCPHTDFGVLRGTIQAIAADAIEGQYAVMVQPTADRLRRGRRECLLRPGMDVEADLVTRRDTVMGVLLRKLRLLTI